jgi:hypothetical protein
MVEKGTGRKANRRIAASQQPTSASSPYLHPDHNRGVIALPTDSIHHLITM